jgi:hypothetical protein
MEAKIMKMTKLVYLAIFILYFSPQLKAQTFDERFEQKKTQIKYLVQQIAALQAYMGALEKGYQIVQQGSKAIANIKKEDFDLHNGYFNSLQAVNPEVARYGRIADIEHMQAAILQIHQQTTDNVNRGPVFSAGEQAVIRGVFSNLISESTNITDALTSVVTPGKLEMSDNERINRIDSLYYAMQRLYNGSLEYSHTIAALSYGRKADIFEAATGTLLYGF